jgi:site-specific DNA-methyltransferase (adenine-specific)
MIIEENDLTVDQAANIANVSGATIRNWIKTGYLAINEKKEITRVSLMKFISEVAGKKKLHSRANKSFKDFHNHDDVTRNISIWLDQNNTYDLGSKYEDSLSDSYRNKEGIFYTPYHVVTDMFKGIEVAKNSRFLDPCCGSGNFIIEAIRQGVSPENVYGYDVDPNAVIITKKRIKDEFGYDSNNIIVANFLEYSFKLSQQGVCFDLIFTNPPWGKKIEKKEREGYSALYGCGSSLDTTSLFLGASLRLLSINGFLGFLNQEAFFNISSFEFIRRKVVSKKIKRFSNYGNCFKGIISKAQAIIIQNSDSKPNNYIECSQNNFTHFRSLNSFLNNPKMIFNFGVTEDESNVIDRLFSVKHTTLSGKANWALGIVTGNNEIFCSKERKDGYIEAYKGSDITKKGLKKASIYIPTDFSKFQQVAPLKMYKAKEKLIYKFISSDLCFYCDTEQRLIINSANLLIPVDLGITSSQLTSLLNSEIINWLFKCLFSTHKILRGDLELLPIHYDYFSVYSIFDEGHYLDYLKIEKLHNGAYRVKK